ncbi:sugar ABC transporter ATP-binding protein [Halogeometricum pallidum JCM 14848]|uniref:ABC-type D-xylose/L-arabinose transporter n=1 Tax=Halogeometricum pallidum JCM 14848 TaxID=1227487 RepID=M0DEN2_HALPD|nr:ABC transporter ATP-binding protein [Halogeometricum pallidum]ELZ32609.1 sugar ABC transporter ATP-binding protein [Halogeometricum pallidum JCM 14848]
MGKLDIRDLRKEFSDSDNVIVAVDDLNIDVKDGEFIVFVGPSGCGKSTTLRCIAGLELPTSGTILLNDDDITNQSATNRDMAMVFQNYALYPHMTARENMSFGLRMGTDLPKDEINERVQDTAEMMGIEELLEKHPGELSGGQQQRVALGRSIVREPEVFLMDEPLSNLDAKLRTTMRTELQELQQRLGVTTIYVTHDQTEAMTMGDRVAILNDGRLQQIGTPLECYHEPANEFVAGFIGSPSMNFIDVSMRSDTEELVHDRFTYPLSPETQSLIADAGASDRLTLGIRPEDIGVVVEETASSFPVTVQVVEPLGEVSYVYFNLGDGTTYTVSVDGDVLIEEGTTVHIEFPEDKIHLFDGKTGTAIKNRTAPKEMALDQQSV